MDTARHSHTSSYQYYLPGVGHTHNVWHIPAAQGVTCWFVGRFVGLRQRDVCGAKINGARPDIPALFFMLLGVYAVLATNFSLVGLALCALCSMIGFYLKQYTILLLLLVNLYLALFRPKVQLAVFALSTFAIGRSRSLSSRPCSPCISNTLFYIIFKTHFIHGNIWFISSLTFWNIIGLSFSSSSITYISNMPGKRSGNRVFIGGETPDLWYRRRTLSSWI